jgi:predicted DNA-binding transcriptional regulator YafY
MNILLVLSHRRFETMANLAHEFQVSFHTIRNDISFLSMDFPIYTRSGKGGGVYVMDDWYFGRTYLNPKQATLLVELMDSLSGMKLEILKTILSDFSNPKNLNKAVNRL